jgi:dihydroflavonol-4-reductase
MSERLDVVFVIPQGLPDTTSHHEATSGMGAVLPPEPRLFLYPPHTVAACVGATQAAGQSTAVVDAFAERLSPSATFARIATFHPEVLAVLVSQGTAYADGNWLRLWRESSRVARRGEGRQPKLLLFGPSVQFVVQPWLAEGLADAALLGEPEAAIAQAVQGLLAGTLQGPVAARELSPRAYDGAGLLTDLDHLPFPAWDAVLWRAYEFVSLLSSRGCPAACYFCAYIVAQGGAIRDGSVEHTLAEWTWLSGQVKPPYLMIRDPVFAQDRARAQALCEGIVARHIQIRWGCESRPEHFDPELLRLMKAAGCVDVKIGMESGDPQLLSRLGRLTGAQTARDYLDQVAKVAAACRAMELCCRVFVMAGLPGEPPDSIARTVAVLRALAPGTIIHAKPYHAYPGTLLAGPSLPVSPEILAQLGRANQPAGPTERWHRVWRTARMRLDRLGVGRAGTRGMRSELSLAADVIGASLTSAGVPGGLSSAHRRVFLTGGNGFLGGHVARALTAAGVDVIALVRPGGHLGALADLSVEIVRGDLRDLPAWASVLKGCDLCFNVAALYAGVEEAEAMYATNVHSVSVLLAACARAGIRRVVHTSTIGTAGRPVRPGELPDETTPFNLWDQASHYVKSKYLGELVARSWAEQGLEVVVVKPTAPVGAGDARPTATGGRILAALRGEVTFYPPGGVNHVPVADVAAGHLLAASRGVSGQTYILGHRNGNLSHRAFLRLIAEVSSTPVLRPPKAVSGGYAPSALTADPTKGIRELGLPQSSLREAFAEAVDWYRNLGTLKR